MKKTVSRLIAAGLFACSAGIALADGIPTAANVMDAPIGGNEWRGFYVSAAVGYGWGDSSFSVTPNTADYEPSGVIGAVGLGYDIMLRDSVLLGVFGDYTFGEQDDKFTLAGIPTKGELDDTWAVGARLGFIVHRDLLLYGTVGYTSTELTLSNAAASESDNLDGFFVGAGLERLIHSNLYLRGEYRYSRYEDIKDQVAAGGYCGGTCDLEIENEKHSLRIGLAYKFGRRDEAPAPLK